MFTLIHKFRIDKQAGETEMPVLSDRPDVIVITDEAHRSQYDTLALNMRQALPNAVVHGLHRHAADRRRGADPPASSATTSASTTSATPSRTAPPSRCTTRTASPSCSWSTTTSPRS